MRGYGLQGSQLYFAYGSNLVARQMRQRCPSARAVGVAYLGGWRIAFGGHSPRWGGAVADVVRAEGAVVPGVLYRMNAHDLEQLDMYEGYPYSYTRRRLWVTKESGRQCVAHVYLQASYRVVSHVAPRYFKAVYDAYRRHDFSTNALLWARHDHNGRVSEDMDRRFDVFVYGTLLQGEPNHRLLQGAKLLGEAETEPRFDMYNLGAFPGVVPGGNTAIRGEVYRVDERTRDALDRLEGHPNFYVRTRARLADGRIVETYLLERDQVAGRSKITVGDWRRRGKGNGYQTLFSFEQREARRTGYVH